MLLNVGRDADKNEESKRVTRNITPTIGISSSPSSGSVSTMVEMLCRDFVRISVLCASIGHEVGGLSIVKF